MVLVGAHLRDLTLHLAGHAGRLVGGRLAVTGLVASHAHSHPFLEVLESRANDRITEDNRAKHRTGARDKCRLLDQPIHQIGVDHKENPNRQLEHPHVRVLVIMPANRA